jgi:hypothetical protein
MSLDLKFTQTGKYLIAAGGEQIEGRDSFRPILYIGIVGDKDWAVRYPVEGKFAKVDDAASAALHYAIQIITRQVKNIPRPGEPGNTSVSLSG